MLFGSEVVERDLGPSMGMAAGFERLWSLLLSTGMVVGFSRVSEGEVPAWA